MFKSFPTRLMPILALLFAFGLMVPSGASADSPILNEAIWIGGPGSSPARAIPIIGTMRNQLDPGKAVWYQTTFSGPPPYGVTLNYTPGTMPPTGTIQLRVDWTTPSGSPSVDWPGYYRVGQGSSYGFAPGLLYWTTSDTSSAIYNLEVVNNSTVPIGYAIALTGSAFPPPVLDPPVPLEILPPLEG